MMQISEEAGIKVGQIYRDFECKEAIVAEIVRCDLDHFLDESDLDCAIVRGDTAAVRQWVSDFVQHDRAPAKGQLLAQIVIEATRNAEIAELFQHTDKRIRCCLERALAHLAPGDTRSAARSRLVETIMVALMGLPFRHIAAPNVDIEAAAAEISRLVLREVDGLRTGDPAFTGPACPEGIGTDPSPSR
ncbi:TetR/AcrR family transcriptional regulator [Sphingomonas sp. AP4-R1]|uniref:TetR/AcrR family transcriptional regulator n=1 Tax=Sphingomonas sp. AP4-R1 TaxID=2735134 RepID=UPI0020A2E2B4|nr:TetR/AcrR family transcriptional regulator [Sphingomonas sp. AP4-R1]